MRWISSIRRPAGWLYVAGVNLALGTWQAIYLIEHRVRPHRREIVLQFVGSTG